MNRFTYVLAIVSFLACKKSPELNAKYFCRVETEYVNVNPGEGDPDIQPFRYYYDQWNNPTEISLPETSGWHETYLFYYDNEQRLSSYTQIGFSHTYTYDKMGRAIIDTMLNYFAGGEQWYEEKIFYDHQNRIIKTIKKLFKTDSTLPNPELNKEYVNEYHYDENGNLIRPGITYDDKINPRRLNQVFMFISRDYSKNNPIYGHMKYNQLGLPETNSGIIGFKNNITYACGNIE